MSRRLKYDIPGPDRRVTPDEVKEKGWAAIFEPDGIAPGGMVVEIGFGRGEFLLDLATRSPECAHVGVEYSMKRVLKMARRLARLPLGNLRLVCAPGEEVVEDLLQPSSVSAFWINFPDPWPKKRHLERRLIQPAFVALLVDRLLPSGDLYIATDHEDYAEQIDAVLAAEPALDNAFAPHRFLREVPGRLPTAYELEWRSEGRPLHYWHQRRRSS